MKLTTIYFLIMNLHLPIHLFQIKSELCINKAQESKIIEYIKLSKPLSFNSENYELKWSANPSIGYYKQEYLIHTDSYANYNKMLLLEYLKNEHPVTLIKTKVNELKRRKQVDSATNYEIIKNPNSEEFIIDFLISDKNVFEWNIYKFLPFKDGTLLYAFSLKSSQNGEFSRENFFAYLKRNRELLINKMISSKLPAIEIK
jgi:hypothetical protein